MPVSTRPSPRPIHLPRTPWNRDATKDIPAAIFKWLVRGSAVMLAFRKRCLKCKLPTLNNRVDDSSHLRPCLHCRPELQDATHRAPRLCGPNVLAIGRIHRNGLRQGRRQAPPAWAPAQRRQASPVRHRAGLEDRSVWEEPTALHFEYPRLASSDPPAASGSSRHPRTSTPTPSHPPASCS